MIDVLQNDKIERELLRKRLKDEFLNFQSRRIIKYAIILMKECGREINEEEAKSLIINVGLYIKKNYEKRFRRKY